MLKLELTPEEEAILEDLLTTCINDLHSEIIHTDRVEYRDALKQRKQVLNKLFQALQATKTPQSEKPEN